MATNGNNQLNQCSDSVSGCVRSQTSRKRYRAPVLLHSQPQESNALPIDINKIKMEDILIADIRLPPQKYRLERKNNNKTNRNKQSSTEIVDNDTSSDSYNLNIHFTREQRFGWTLMIKLYWMTRKILKINRLNGKIWKKYQNVLESYGPLTAVIQSVNCQSNGGNEKKPKTYIWHSCMLEQTLQLWLQCLPVPRGLI